ncbi:MAG: hypothetical protein A2Z30_01750 [Chloroflexi bacterium RBG_16_64_43]|nr:MAG: hypothetical protein A2Z30_01750 [Chloroflexi bacterium RBG_16_64_43]
MRLVNDGRDRSYALHVPAGLDAAQPVALVLAFHGGLGTASYMPALTGFSRKADREGFLVAYPNGTGALDDRLFTWNGGTCCGYATRENVDDTGFVRAVIDDIASRLPVDPRRIFATGISNGGILSYRLACEMADRVAAIGSVAGTQNLPGCAPSAPVSILHIHGTADQHLPFEGGVGPESLAGVDFASVADSINFWQRADQCPAEAMIAVSGIVTHTTYAPCAAGSAVELYAIEGGGHAWPGGIAAWQGGDPPPMELNATDVLWSFFAAHPKP